MASLLPASVLSTDIEEALSRGFEQAGLGSSAVPHYSAVLKSFSRIGEWQDSYHLSLAALARKSGSLSLIDKIKSADLSVVNAGLGWDHVEIAQASRSYLTISGYLRDPFFAFLGENCPRVVEAISVSAQSLGLPPRASSLYIP